MSTITIDLENIIFQVKKTFEQQLKQTKNLTILIITDRVELEDFLENKRPVLEESKKRVLIETINKDAPNTYIGYIGEEDIVTERADPTPVDIFCKIHARGVFKIEEIVFS